MSSDPPAPAPTRLEMMGWPYDRLVTWLAERGLPEPHARAWFATLHRKGTIDTAAIETMGPTLSPRLWRLLDDVPPGEDLTTEEVSRSKDGTIKLVFRTPAGDAFESVIIPQGERRTLCVSSQVGCAVGCPFCFTGTMGLKRNLAAWEIVSQFRFAREVSDAPIENIVFMGMGEPLHNEEAVGDACAVLGSDYGLALARSRLVVSTSGLVPRLRPFWDRQLAVFALSLHATTDEQRDVLVPLNKKWNLATLKAALMDIPWRGRETLTVEYVMLRGVNDSPDDAARLVEWCDGLPAKVNLIELNPFPGSPYERCDRQDTIDFRDDLRARGLFATLRPSRGDDVLAACGQLALGGTERDALPRGHDHRRGIR